MRLFLLALLLATPLGLSAQDREDGQGRALFMNDMLGDRTFFEPWGIGIDFYTMEQPMAISSLEFMIPGIPGFEIDPDKVDVDTKLQHYDLKLDAWITPFLNVFGLVGHLEADTRVDLRSVTIPGVPISLGQPKISYDGTVYGLGFTLAYGGEHWFTSLTSTWTDTSISGDFESSVSSFTAQPRIGLIRDKWNFWLGAMYLDTDEQHSGAIELIPGFPPVAFDVELESLEAWNYSVGAGYVFSPKSSLRLEIGFGDRDHTLFNYTYRF